MHPRLILVRLLPLLSAPQGQEQLCPILITAASLYHEWKLVRVRGAQETFVEVGHGTAPGREGLNTQWLKTNVSNRAWPEEGRRAGLPRTRCPRVMLDKGVKEVAVVHLTGFGSGFASPSLPGKFPF